MLGYYLGVGVKECPPCGGELIGLHGNRIFKLGGERDRAASSAQPFPRRSARLRPHPSKPCAVLERLLSPRNLWQIPFGARTQFKNSHSPLWRSPQGQQQVGSYSRGVSRARSRWGSPHPAGKYLRSLRS